MTELAQKQPCVLTISLLVSNNKTTIRNCLESLRPLLEAVPSELIVVDTVGPEKSDGSLAIAKEYATQVVRFKWCNDFAAARNAGLAQAHGDWFLFLDDDEWFDDVTELIEFFNDEQARQAYNSLEYSIRNYTTFNGSAYHDITTKRCVKRSAATHFYGEIHERLGPIYTPVKPTSAYVHHYGYINQLNTTKLERNNRLLEAELKQNPQNMHAWSQLAVAQPQESVRDLEKLTGIFNEAYLNLTTLDHPSDEELFDFMDVLVALLEVTSKCRRWESLLKLLARYKQDLKETAALEGVVAYFSFKAHFNLGENTAMARAGFDYLRFCQTIKDGHGQVKDTISQFSQGFFEDITVMSVANQFVESLAEAEKWSDILDTVAYLPWERQPAYSDQLIYNLLWASYSVHSYRGIQYVCDQLHDLPQNFTQICSRINHQKVDREVNFLSFITRLQVPGEALAVQRLLLHQQELSRYLPSFVGQVSYPNHELLLAMIKQGLNPEPYLTQTSFDQWQLTLAAIYEELVTTPSTPSQLREQVMQAWPETGTSFSTSVLVLLFEVDLFREGLLYSLIRPELMQYLVTGQRAVQLFRQRYPDKELGADLQIVQTLQEGLSLFEQTRYHEGLAKLTAIIHHYPGAKGLVKTITLYYQKVQATPVMQQQQLIDQLSSKIKVLYHQGLVTEAQQVIDQLQILAPTNSQVQLLKKMVKK